MLREGRWPASRWASAVGLGFEYLEGHGNS